MPEPAGSAAYTDTVTIEELYSCPENILEIRVRNPATRGDGRDRYTDYEIFCQTNLPMFSKQVSLLRRRYSEFLWLHDVLVRENPTVKIPDLPPRRFFSRNFDDATIEERRAAFQRFLQLVCSHPIIQNGPSARLLVSFLQDPTE